MKRILVYVIALLLIQVYSAGAAPGVSTISGAFFEGSSVSIAGSNFGTKSVAAPVKWDNFNDGTNANRLNTSKWPIQTTQGGSTYPTYSNSVLRTGDVMSVKTVMGGSQYNCSFGYNGTGNRYWYISYWRYDIAGAAVNFKHFRIYGNSGELPQASYTELSSEASLYGIWDEPSADEQCCEWGGVGIRNAWTREEFYLDAGTRGNSDGSAKYWRNASLLKSFSFNYPALNSGYSGELANPRIGHFWNTDAGNITSYFSEVYIDNTQARVEIGNNSTWASCTHREIQISTAWSDSSISISVNKGSFVEGDTVYLFVVDANGNANSQGYPVTIQKAVAPPSAPKGLRIVQ